MINLEQVKLLEAKVSKAIDYVERMAKENAVLHQQESNMQTKLDSYQKRIDELEILVTGFKDDQDQIEEGILSALDRLGQFEKAMEKTLREKPAAKAQSAAPEAAADNPGEGQTCFEIPEAAVVADASEGNAPELDIF